MAYFDSSKNRALWEIRLGQLRKERAAREAGTVREAGREPAARERSGTVRIPISYQELLKREARERGKKREGPGREKERERLQERRRQKEGQAQEMQPERQARI